MHWRTGVLTFTFTFSLSLIACEGDGETPADTDGSTDGGDGDGDGDGDTGDGDGDSGDGDGDTGDGDGDGDDPLAAAACEALVNGTPEALVAALDAGDAATAPVVSDGQSVYMVTLPEGAPGF